MTAPTKLVPPGIVLATALLLGWPSGSSAELSLVLDGRRQPVPGFDARPEGTPGDGGAGVLADPPATGPDRGEVGALGPDRRGDLGTFDAPPGPASGAAAVSDMAAPEGMDLLVHFLPIIEFPAMSLLVINPSVIDPSVMATPSLELSVLMTSRPDVPQHLSSRVTASPDLSSNDGRNPGGALSDEGDPYGEPEARGGTAYVKPLSRVLGTLLLFLILGLMFLRGRRDVGSR